jgi:hypothetical protein
VSEMSISEQATKKQWRREQPTGDWRHARERVMARGRSEERAKEQTPCRAITLECQRRGALARRMPGV